MKINMLMFEIFLSYPHTYSPTMVCPSVRGVFPVQVDSHEYNYFIPHLAHYELFRNKIDKVCINANV